MKAGLRTRSAPGWVLAGLAVCGVAACSGGNSTPTPTSPGPIAGAPTPQPTPTPTPAPTSWTLAGEVVATSGGRVGGATLQFGGASVVTDPDGRFSLQHEAVTDTELVLSHPSILERHVWLRGATNRSGLTLDPISLAAPFDLEFFRQFVRNAYDSDGTSGWRPWTSAPSFYIRTLDAAGVEIDPATVAAVVNGINEAVPQFSPFRPAVIETGTAERGERLGWVIVTFEPRPRDDFLTCGTATVGGNSGRMQLWLDSCRAAGETRVSRWVVLHEVGHTMGFRHTRPGHVMHGIVDYGVRNVTERERYHAAIAYRRPWGNVEPDSDPPTALASGAGTSPQPVVRCGG